VKVILSDFIRWTLEIPVLGGTIFLGYLIGSDALEQNKMAHLFLSYTSHIILGSSLYFIAPIHRSNNTTNVTIHSPTAFFFLLLFSFFVLELFSPYVLVLDVAFLSVIK